jgi:hypothetical protein
MFRKRGQYLGLTCRYPHLGRDPLIRHVEIVHRRPYWPYRL